MPAFSGDGYNVYVQRLTVTAAQDVRPKTTIKSRRIAIRNETAAGGQPLRVAFQLGEEAPSTASDYVTIQPQAEFELPVGTERLAMAADDGVGPCTVTLVWMFL